MESSLLILNPKFDLTFWRSLYYIKLEKLRLSESPILVTGKIKPQSQSDNGGNLDIEFDCFSLEEQDLSIKQNSYYSVSVQGIIKIFNKVESFEEFVENGSQISLSEMKETNEEFFKNFDLKDVKTLREKMFLFYIPIFVNLKTFEFRYQFLEAKLDVNYSDLWKRLDSPEEAAPSFDVDYEALEKVNGFCVNQAQNLFYGGGSRRVGQVLVTYLLNEFYGSEMSKQVTEDIELPVHVQESALVLNMRQNKYTYKPVKQKKTKISLNALKVAGPGGIKTYSVGLYQIKFQKVEGNVETRYSCQNSNISSLNLKKFLSKENLVEEQSNLNIKLMKWRLEPDLQLDHIQNLKVLLVGSGTLGCNMGRLLCSWGISQISFIDYGKVSYSNLARQSLFTMNDFDSAGQGLGKAEACVKNMKLLIPSSKATAHSFKIPMPGHFCTEKTIDSEFENLKRLEELVKSHDVVFNILDTREARYFPTILSAVYNKLCISVGLGYDNYVIVKHGYRNFKHLVEGYKGNRDF